MIFEVMATSVAIGFLLAIAALIVGYWRDMPLITAVIVTLILVPMAVAISTAWWQVVTR